MASAHLHTIHGPSAECLVVGDRISTCWPARWGLPSGEARAANASGTATREKPLIWDKGSVILGGSTQIGSRPAAVSLSVCHPGQAASGLRAPDSGGEEGGVATATASKPRVRCVVDFPSASEFLLLTKATPCGTDHCGGFRGESQPRKQGGPEPKLAAPRRRHALHAARKPAGREETMGSFLFSGRRALARCYCRLCRPRPVRARLITSSLKNALPSTCRTDLPSISHTVSVVLRARIG
jgi:hypothetical protein